jgi:hypothetical protein
MVHESGMAARMGSRAWIPSTAETPVRSGTVFSSRRRSG